ncbi:MAG: hypothetical protein HQM13_19645 [SAR324 cluster bacterium]|nr:hypothetical protein [SAR324 cluster bacterium]
MKRFQKALFLKKMVFAALILFLLMGCSSIQLVYEFGDDYLEWKLDDYFDLTHEQEAFVEESIDQYFIWHRQEELPQYVQLLEKLSQESADGVTKEELDWAFAQYEKRRDVLLEQVIPKTAKFLSGLHAEQIKVLEATMLEENKEMAEGLERSRNKQGEEDLEKFLGSLNEWFGELNPKQVKQLTQWHQEWNKNRADRSSERLERRKNSQSVFLALLKTDPSQEKVDQWLRQQVRLYVSPLDPDAQSKRNERIERNKKRILMVDSILTRQQRQNAIEELQSYIDQMRNMVIKPKST